MEVNSSLQKLKYAATHNGPKPLRPPNGLVPPYRSVSNNNLTNDGEDMSGLIELAKSLEQNRTLVSLE